MVMAYTKQARAQALRLVAAQGYHIAAALTGISESSLRKWAQDQATRDHQLRERTIHHDELGRHA